MERPPDSRRRLLVAVLDGRAGVVRSAHRSERRAHTDLPAPLPALRRGPVAAGNDALSARGLRGARLSLARPERVPRHGRRCGRRLRPDARRGARGRAGADDQRHAARLRLRGPRFQRGLPRPRSTGQPDRTGRRGPQRRAGALRSHERVACPRSHGRQPGRHASATGDRRRGRRARGLARLLGRTTRLARAGLRPEPGRASVRPGHERAGFRVRGQRDRRLGRSVAGVRRLAARGERSGCGIRHVRRADVRAREPEGTRLRHQRTALRRNER